MFKYLRRVFVCIVFFVLIFGPGILQFSSNLLQKKLDISLSGNFDVIDKPTLSLNSFASGEYQTLFKNWLNQNLMPRAIFIKVYNQLQFSLFSQGNRPIGKNNYIYEPGYIEDELCLVDKNWSILEKQEEMQAYVNHLVSINQKLEKLGKHLFLYSTPSKAHYFKENIPSQYLVQENEGIRGIDYFRQLVADKDINYLDTEKLVVNDQYPLFYSTGIHWSRTIEQRSSVEVMNEIRSITGKKLRNIKLGDVQERNTPIWRDSDVYDLLNTYIKSYDSAYYEYETSREFPKEYEKTNILLQGGSFSEGLQHDFFNNYINEKCYYINYGNTISDEDGWHTISQWSDLELDKYLDKVDCVVIEINEAVISMYSSGFVEYLDSYLDSYVSEKSLMKESDTNLDPSNFIGLANSRGFFGYEESHLWSTCNSYVTLVNDNISKRGLKMRFSIPEQTLNNGEDKITIYINQHKVYEYFFNDPGMVELSFSPEDMGIGDNDTYEIEFICEKSFNPKSLGMSDDNRDLAIDVFYIGEM